MTSKRRTTFTFLPAMIVAGLCAGCANTHRDRSAHVLKADQEKEYRSYLEGVNGVERNALEVEKALSTGEAVALSMPAGEFAIVGGGPIVKFAKENHIEILRFESYPPNQTSLFPTTRICVWKKDAQRVQEFLASGK